MSPDRFDEVLREAAADYNRPPEPPREEMWSRIQAAREEQRLRAQADRFRARRVPGWVAAAVGMAAMLVIGIGIGRVSFETGAEAGTGTIAARDADRAGEAAGGAGDVGVETAVAGDGDPARLAAGEEAGGPDGTGATDGAVRPGADAAGGTEPTRLAAAEPGAAAERGGRAAAGEPAVTERAPAVAERVAAAGERPVAPGAEPGDVARSPERRSSPGVYRYAAVTTLGQAEALLTSVRSEAAAGRLDPQVGTWARDVLSTTRLLLDSPAGSDAELGQLLADLELVLVQIVQLAAGEDPAALELIQESIKTRNVLPRLRTAVPAGLSAGA